MNDHGEIGTERLILRPLALGQAEQLHSIFSDPDTMRFWPTPRHRDVNDTLAMIDRFLLGSERAWVLFVGVEAKAIGLVYYLGNQGVPGMGYILHPLYRGRGLMSEGCKLASRTATRY